MIGKYQGRVRNNPSSTRLVIYGTTWNVREWGYVIWKYTCILNDETRRASRDMSHTCGIEWNRMEQNGMEWNRVESSVCVYVMLWYITTVMRSTSSVTGGFEPYTETRSQ